MAVKRGLGKGLGALIDSAGEPSAAEKSAGTADVSASKNGIIEIDINKIEPNKQQPRKYFDEQTLGELAESIKEYGIIQPIIVKEENGYYSIIAGERRWRAARMAKLPYIPAIIKDYNAMETLQIALVENLQRQDLNPIEEAICYKKLIDDFFYSQEEVASKVGKSRNTVSYSLSLLNLGKRTQDLVIDGRLSPAHARLLLAVRDEEKQFLMAQKIAEDQPSVKETEKIIETLITAEPEEQQTADAIRKKKYNAYVRLESDLQNIFGTKVNIIDGKKKGKIEIEYYSPEELDRLLGILKTMEV